MEIIKHYPQTFYTVFQQLKIVENLPVNLELQIYLVFQIERPLKV